MADRTPETESVTVSIPARLADFIGSIWARALTILAAISIVIGIALEIESLVTGYYGLQKTMADAEISEANSQFAHEIRVYEVKKAYYEADISRENARFADANGKYP